MKKYQIIYADPPWQYGTWGATASWLRPNSHKRPLPFPTMSVDEICALPVSSLADKNCELYLWTTQKYLPDVFRVIDDWGFKYKQTLIWCKPPRCGLGGAYTPTNEFLILARKGKKPKAKRILTTWFLIKRPHNHHSEKPAFFRDMIASVTNSPRIELFARQKTEGWDVWGNEVESDIELV
jgi:N6-adenosine-specific RNA methylase IME4